MNVCKNKKDVLKYNLEHNKNYSFEIDNDNQRLIITSYSIAKPSHLLQDWITLTRSYNLSKIWLWCYTSDVEKFLKCGFQREGMLEQNEPHKCTVSLAYFVKPERGKSQYLAEENFLLAKVTATKGTVNLDLPSSLSLKLLEPEDCKQISSLLGRVFSTYPTPVTEPSYLQKLMHDGCLFAGIYQEHELISMAAAYPDVKTCRCEITDCATLSSFRGLSLVEKIISFLEQQVQVKNDYTLFSLARARSFGMNRVFHKLKYSYQGRLINNCNIAGGYEDMNLWVKKNRNKKGAIS